MILDFKQIQASIPHRYPFLLVDRVLEVRAGEYCKVVKNVSGSEPFFQGHFPNNPVMPGVLIVEAMTQAAGIAISQSKPNPSEVAFLLGSIDSSRFKRPVTPGDQLVLEAWILSERKNFSFIKGKACVDGKVVATADVKLMIT